MDVQHLFEDAATEVRLPVMGDPSGYPNPGILTLEPIIAYAMNPSRAPCCCGGTLEHAVQLAGLVTAGDRRVKGGGRGVFVADLPLDKGGVEVEVL